MHWLIFLCHHHLYLQNCSIFFNIGLSLISNWVRMDFIIFGSTLSKMFNCSYKLRVFYIVISFVSDTSSVLQKYDRLIYLVLPVCSATYLYIVLSFATFIIAFNIFFYFNVILLKQLTNNTQILFILLLW